jgi:rubrerythrin
MFAISDGGTGVAGPVGILIYVVFGAFVIAGVIWFFNRKELAEIYNARKTTDERPKITGSMWKCPVCGEQVDPELGRCWKCGTEKKDHVA